MFKLLYNRSECITDIRFRIRPLTLFCITDDIYTNPLTLKKLIAESKIFLIHDLAHFVYTRTQVKRKGKRSYYTTNNIFTFAKPYLTTRIYRISQNQISNQKAKC